MPKRLLSLILSAALLFSHIGIFAFADFEISLSADSAVLITADTKAVLFSKNADKKRGMASTTKIMTSVIALEYAMPQMTVTVKGADAAVEGTSVGLKDGDEITLYTLVAAMLLESGNDAANVTAAAVSGSFEGFSQLMNEKARSIGMLNTNFENPSGLPSENHYSTAYDMALLASYALNIPEFANICSKKSMTVSFGAENREYTFTNHNKLLSLYEGAVGIKTGFTKSSGRCLVSAVKKDGVTLIAVTLNAPDDWNDHIKLYDYGFKCVKKVNWLEGDGLYLDVGGSGGKKVKLEAVPEFYTVGENTAYTTEIRTEKSVFAPIEKGDCLGEAVLKNSDGKISARALLVASKAVAATASGKEKTEKQSLWGKFIKFIKDLFS